MAFPGDILHPLFKSAVEVLAFNILGSVMSTYFPCMKQRSIQVGDHIELHASATVMLKVIMLFNVLINIMEVLLVPPVCPQLAH